MQRTDLHCIRSAGNTFNLIEIINSNTINTKFNVNSAKD
jgi:hypothetical protein